MKKVLAVLTLMLIFTCSKSDSNQNEIQQETDGWLVDENDVTGIFGLFPLVVNPEYDTVANTDLPDNELVGIMKFGSEIRVYPYVFTFDTEVVNDTYQGQKYVFSYCPITKSAVGFTRTGVFRASGFLFKDNVTPWDDQSESIWSQMLFTGIKGDRINEKMNTIPIVETNWATVKSHFPNAKVIKRLSSSFGKISTSKPPGDDGDGDDGNNGEEPGTGEFVYGILDNFDNVNIFKYGDFGSKNRIDVKIGSQNYIVYGSSSKRIINAFKVGDFDDFTTLENEFPFILQDRNGVKYDIFGVSRNGSILAKPKFALVAAWWAWDAFYTDFNFQ